MTAKEKALKLFYMFNTITSNEFKSDTFKSAESAKQCVLLCIAEVMETIAYQDHTIKQHYENQSDLSDDMFASYWEEVQTEINKL